MNSYKTILIRGFLLQALFSSVLFFTMLQLYILTAEQPAFTAKTALFLSLFTALLLVVSALYIGIRTVFKWNGELAKVSLFLKGLRSGKLPEKLRMEEMDSAARVAEEANQLADFIKEQIELIQRMSDEKSLLSEQAHTAAVIEERQRIARDLHDAVSQQLFALNMMASSAVKVFDQSPASAKEQLRNISETAVSAQGEMRALLMHLRPVQLQKDSLSDGVIKLLQELKSRTSLEFHGSIDEVEGLTKAAEEHLFRIVQEAISNTLRHAEAEKIKVTLSEEESYIHLYISDNGKGFDPTDKKMASYGIRSMQERCKEIGGILQIRSNRNEGTYIDIKVPVKGGRHGKD